MRTPASWARIGCQAQVNEPIPFAIKDIHAVDAALGYMVSHMVSHVGEGNAQISGHLEQGAVAPPELSEKGPEVTDGIIDFSESAYSG